jgi:hypothetical protein
MNSLNSTTIFGQNNGEIGRKFSKLAEFHIGAQKTSHGLIYGDFGEEELCTFARLRGKSPKPERSPKTCYSKFSEFLGTSFRIRVRSG